LPLFDHSTAQPCPRTPPDVRHSPDVSASDRTALLTGHVSGPRPAADTAAVSAGHPHGRAPGHLSGATRTADTAAGHQPDLVSAAAVRPPARPGGRALVRP